MARPAGSQNKDKPFRDALRLEVAEAGEDLKQLRKIARQLLANAEAGDIQAIKEVADRLDGKPAQAVELSGEVQQTYVVRMPARPVDMTEWQKRYALSPPPIQ